LPPGSGRKEIGMANQAVSQPANQAVSEPAFDLAFPVVPGLLTIAPGASAQHWLEYVTDACQRGALFLELLRRPGNEEKEITAQPMATVLRFDHELLMSGQSLPKPINFALSRIVPPQGVEIDPHKRPVVVVDPRAGQGPGIGGFKAQSEIGDALQSLGWILDLYRDVDDIRATGRTIVYCLNQTVWHLAIFVSSKVGAKEDEEMVRLMDLIDCLPPGLYEMVISPCHAAAQPGKGGPDAWMSRFEARTLDDIRALGRNSEADDRAFAAVARMSEVTDSIYPTFWQPAIRAMVTQEAADSARRLHPMRLSYTAFADSNPLMKSMEKLAAEVSAARRPASPDNPFLQLQKQVSDQIVSALNAYRDTRDRIEEEMFFAICGSPAVQGMLGVNSGEQVRELPGTTPERRAGEEAQAAASAAKLRGGGLAGALPRGVLYVVAAGRARAGRGPPALAPARRDLPQMSIDQYKTLVRDQFFVLLLERERAVEALATMVREPDQRVELLKRTSAIIGAGDPPTAAERERIARLEKLLAAPVAKRAGRRARGPGGVQRGRRRR